MIKKNSKKKKKLKKDTLLRGQLWYKGQILPNAKNKKLSGRLRHPEKKKIAFSNDPVGKTVSNKY